MIVRVEDLPFKIIVEIEQLETDSIRVVQQVLFNRFTKTYCTLITLREGDDIEVSLNQIKRFLRSNRSPDSINRFFREAERESQLREGYYRGIDSVVSEY